jgi:serine/threonine-protein kinase
MSLSIGQVINGKYRIVRLLGEGGMGSVYEAMHEGLRSRVAVKALHPELASSGVGPRFLQEARAAALIQSPHVVRVADVDQTPDGQPYMVLEYLEGKTLQQHYEQLYREGKSLPYADALDYAMQMFEGVEAAHMAGIVHRDLKPDNVMITATSKGAALLKLVDFGIAKVEDKSDPRSVRTRAGVIMGTPEYMAPEQVYSAETADSRTDIFSLGVIVFEMLAGRRPVAGDEPQEIAVAYLTGQVARLSSLMPTVPPEIEAAVHRAMAPKPADRLQTVQQFREAIEPFALAMRPPATSRASMVLAPSSLSNLKGTVPMSAVATPSGRAIPETRMPSSASIQQAPAPSDEPARPLPYGDPASPYSVGNSYPAAPGPSMPPVSVPQFPYGSAPLVGPPPAHAPKGPSTALIAGIVALVIVVVSSVILWSIYYFTDVFDDPKPAVKKPGPKPAKPAPTTKAPHPGK